MDIVVLKKAMMVAILIGAMALALNQSISYLYKSHLLKAPCNLCLEANPELQLCNKINEKNISFVKDYGDAVFINPIK